MHDISFEIKQELREDSLNEEMNIQLIVSIFLDLERHYIEN